MIVLLWFDTRYLNEGRLKEKTFNDYDDFGVWFVAHYKHVHVVDLKVIRNE